VIDLTQNTDAELLARYQSGEAEALTAIFERYEPPVFRYLFGLLRDRHAAEDVLQDTFVMVLRKADAATGETFRGWLFTVAHQQAMLLKRKTKRIPTAVPDDKLLALIGAESDPAVRLSQHDTILAVRSLLELLPETHRQVIRLRVFDGLKFREVAERLGCPLNTALARMHDGVRTLRRLWEEHHA
jgi:RNA polymerase sigma-70 factor, ECF subfamily